MKVWVTKYAMSGIGVIPCVDRLLAEGFGGDRKIFPISAFVRRIDQ